jgi:hypothetical protein
VEKKFGKVQLDLNSGVFQRHLFHLEKDQQRAVLNTLQKLSEMTWEQVYKDRGLRWEAVVSRGGKQDEKLYSVRMGKGFRALVSRNGDFLRPVSLHPDHDSAYKP